MPWLKKPSARLSGLVVSEDNIMVSILFSPAAIAATEAALGGEPIAGDDSQVLKQILIVAANLIS